MVNATRYAVQPMQWLIQQNNTHLSTVALDVFLVLVLYSILLSECIIIFFAGCILPGGVPAPDHLCLSAGAKPAAVWQKWPSANLSLPGSIRTAVTATWLELWTVSVQHTASDVYLRQAAMQCSAAAMVVAAALYHTC